MAAQNHKEIIKYSSILIAGLAKVKEYFTRIRENGMYYCKCCGFGERNASNMRYHIEKNHYSPGYTCYICGSVFAINNTLRRHLKRCAANFGQSSPIPSAPKSAVVKLPKLALAPTAKLPNPTATSSTSNLQTQQQSNAKNMFM